MKKLLLIVLIYTSSYSASAQSQEAQQLLLNWEKLAQLKAILQNMYDGYEVVSKGYNTIKDISQGNFSLHQVFLNGLLEVSPLCGIISELQTLSPSSEASCRNTKKLLIISRSSSSFTSEEINYMGKVYTNLFQQSLKSLNELIMVITAGTLRMSDDERLKAIDKIFTDMQDKLTFLRSFNSSTKMLAVQRDKEQSQIDLSRKLSGIK
jgi:hypothetical protein